jgi:hypothetical protein
VTDREHLEADLHTLTKIRNRVGNGVPERKGYEQRNADEVTMRMAKGAIERIKRQMDTPLIEQVLGE